MSARSLIVGAALGALLLVPSVGVAAPSMDAAVKKALPKTVSDYEWFHAHPELSEQEAQTAKRLAARLKEIGLEVHEGIGGHGLVGILRSKGARADDPVVLYRADMDGLPVTESTGVPYASKNAGVMHACGHDVHMATALGALRVMAARTDWKGTIFFVGQPAEELGKGARAMLADPAFKRLIERVGKPTVAVALHDAADLAAGDVSIIPEFHHANVDSVDIVIHGKGGHGARPHETIDPIVIGAEVVMALQTIVSRRIPPDEKAVVTVGKFAAGTKHNIIPPSATLLLTVRSYSAKTRATLKKEIARVARDVARAHRAPRAPEIRFGAGLPAAYNDPAWTKKVTAAFEAELGKEHVKRHDPSLGGEDFGIFPTELGIPGVMWKLGGVDPKAFAKSTMEELPGLHSDRWAPAAKPTLATGIRSVVRALEAGLAG